jgi:hypothetical protein
MNLTITQKAEFKRKGFLKISGVVPQKQINLALREINHCLGKGMEPSKVATYRSTTYCPEITMKPAIMDLIHETAAWKILESAIAPRKFRLDGRPQIALRFPVMEKPGELHPHIDGMSSANNRIKKGNICTFTALAGFLLSDIPNRYWGNFTGWPGTHEIFAEYFRQHGPNILKRRLPPVAMPEAEQVTGKAGDLILSHYLTAHTVVVNVSPYIRYAVFFRIKHMDHNANGEKVFTDLWHEWPGMRTER